MITRRRRRALALALASIGTVAVVTRVATAGAPPAAPPVTAPVDAFVVRIAHAKCLTPRARLQVRIVGVAPGTTAYISPQGTSHPIARADAHGVATTTIPAPALRRGQAPASAQLVRVDAEHRRGQSETVYASYILATPAACRALTKIS